MKCQAGLTVVLREVIIRKEIKFVLPKIPNERKHHLFIGNNHFS